MVINIDEILKRKYIFAYFPYYVQRKVKNINDEHNFNCDTFLSLHSEILSNHFFLSQPEHVLIYNFIHSIKVFEVFEEK